MPPSPPRPPPPPPHEPTLIRIDPETASAETLLDLLGIAYARRDLPRESEPDRGVDEGPPLASHLDDLAADTLAQQHAARRARELEWDEQDNAERRVRALDAFTHRYAELLGAADNVGHDDFSEEEEEDDDDEPMDGIVDDDGYETGWMHTDHEDFHIAGFDGDILDGPSSGDSAEGDEHADGDRQLAAAAFRSMLPGYAGERPLNPSRNTHVAPRDVYSAADPVVPYLSRDPSSALSFSSFLQLGATFVGEQTFGTRGSGASGSAAGTAGARRRSPTRRAGTTSTSNVLRGSVNAGTADDVSTAHPAFAPAPAPAAAAAGDDEWGVISLPAQSTSTSPPWRGSSPFGIALGPSSSFAIPRPPSSARSSAAVGTGPYLAGSAMALAIASMTNGANSPLRSNAAPTTRYAPYTASSSSSAAAPAGASSATQSAAAPHAGSVPRAYIVPGTSDAAARARARVAQSVNPAARSSRSSWGEVGEELLNRAMARERAGVGLGAVAGAGAGLGVLKGRGGGEDERWSVKVTILTYDPEARSIAGLMRAHGVAIPPNPIPPLPPNGPSSRPTSGDVTTFFTGTILHPILDGLFCSPGEFRVTRASEAESWIKLGPFKGLSKGYLLECAKNRTWVEERTQGWVLFRWKERDFVNVTAKESSLSISGFYHVALNRQTGDIEGLYHDPAASPHQRLVLSPVDNDRGAFGLGSFAFC